jgi:predicted short-subunit dehydrogenase-like oxidoreductase (DUF2520 family)
VARIRKSRPSITLVGAGSLAHAFGPALKAAGYRIDVVAGRSLRKSRQRAAALAKKLGADLILLEDLQPASEIIWLCHTDDALAETARVLSRRKGWKGKIVLHSSGALSSDVLAPLQRAGAYTASLHPMMTFVPGTTPEMEKVPFAVEGDRRAVATAKRIVKNLKAEVFEIKKESKVLYHALGSFSSPMIVATLVTAERVGKAAGLSAKQVAKVMTRILLQTIDNYVQRGAAAAFSGPIKRGDLNTVRRHLQELRNVPGAPDVYRALVKSALMDLPVENKEGLLLLISGAQRGNPTDAKNLKA